MLGRVLLALAVVALLAPAAGAEKILGGQTPGPVVAYVPQIACHFVFDNMGSDECRVDGRVTFASSVSVRATADSLVHVFLYDATKKTQVASFDCEGSCVKTFPSFSGDVVLLVDVVAPMPGAVSVSVQSGPVHLV